MSAATPPLQSTATLLSPRIYSLAFLLALCAVAQPLQARGEDGPNIVYIMADELGYYELSHMGHPHIRTPNIDKMAAEGMRFTQCLAGSSLCAPTRCVLMTGKHSGHTSVRTNGGGTPLRADEATIASMLKSRGYATGGFGKWGCGGRGSTGVPEKHGFDEFVGYYDQVHAHSYYPKYIVRNSEELPLPGNKGLSTGKTYSHYVIVDHAMQFIRDSRKQNRPFFCYMPITPPHGLFDIPDEDPAWKMYQDKDWPESAKRYAAMITMVDRQVGDVFRLLRELSIDKNTIVFFCGDNGGNDYFADAAHPRGFHAPNVNPKTGVAFRGRKGNLYEGGLRIPMIASWPGHIAPGQVSDRLCYFPDMMPTFAELTGASAPADTDGLSLVPELIGSAAAGREQADHEFLYWELGNQVAVRMGDWKAVRPGAKKPWELYDLSKDISENHNLAADKPEILARMQAHAAASHVDAVEGEFLDRSLQQRDQRARSGDMRPPARRRGKAKKFPATGLVPRSEVRIHKVSSESKSNGRTAAAMLDGDPTTHWHTQFGGQVSKHPHLIVLDLGRSRTVRGLRYMARQDEGWNGTIARCEVGVSDDGEHFPEQHATVSFQKTRDPQDAAVQGQGRYVHIRILSEVNGGPWASIAELGVLGQ